MNYFYRNPKHFDILFMSAGIGMVGFGVYQIVVPYDFIQSLYSKDTLTIHGFRASGTLGFAYNYGAFLNVFLIYLLSKMFDKINIVHVILIIFSTLLILATQSRTSYVVAILSLIYFLTMSLLIVRKSYNAPIRKSIVVLFFIFITVIIFITHFDFDKILETLQYLSGKGTDSSLRSRASQIEYGIDAASERLFLLGYGATKEAPTIENLYIDYLHDYGIFGLIIYVFSIIFIIVHSFKSIIRYQTTEFIHFFITVNFLNIMVLMYGVATILTDAYRFSYIYYYLMGAYFGIEYYLRRRNRAI